MDIVFFLRIPTTERLNTTLNFKLMLFVKCLGLGSKSTDCCQRELKIDSDERACVAGWTCRATQRYSTHESVVSDVAAPMARETKTNITTALLTTQPSSTLPIHHSTPLYGRGSKEAEITTVEYRGSIFNDSS